MGINVLIMCIAVYYNGVNFFEHHHDLFDFTFG
jgi:hypothetical protein